jgi:hypothetical protein
MRVLACFVIGFCISAFTGWAHKAVGQHSARGVEIKSAKVASKPSVAVPENSVADNNAKSFAAAQAQASAPRESQTPAQQQATPVALPDKAKAAPAESPHPAMAAAQEKSDSAKKPQPIAKDDHAKAAIARQNSPVTAVEREKLAATDRNASIPSVVSKSSVAPFATATSPRTVSSQQTVPNPVFYVDLGPAQDPDAPKPTKSDASAENGPAVSYRNGQLTINVKNVTLSNVLQMVAQKTRSRIDVPPEDGGERIAVHAGPGSPDQVLAQLLKGSPFNFVIVHSPQHPEELQQVLLTVRGPGEPEGVKAPEQAEAEPPKQGLPKELLEKLFSRKRPPDDVSNAPDQTPPPSEQQQPAPNGQASPEVVEQLMKDKANEIRQNADQQ